MRKKCFCYSCENYYTVITDSTDPIEHCPFCGMSLDDDNHDELEDEE